MKALKAYRKHMQVHGTAPLWFAMPLYGLLLAALVALLLAAAK